MLLPKVDKDGIAYEFQMEVRLPYMHHLLPKFVYVFEVFHHVYLVHLLDLHTLLQIVMEDRVSINNAMYELFGLIDLIDHRLLLV